MWCCWWDSFNNRYYPIFNSKGTSAAIPDQAVFNFTTRFSLSLSQFLFNGLVLPPLLNEPHLFYNKCFITLKNSLMIIQISHEGHV